MSFIEIVEKYENFDFYSYLDSITYSDVEKSLSKTRKDEFDFLNLLSDKALPYIEDMAKESHRLTIQYFGKTIQLYIPIYVSDYCNNSCIYCGFSVLNKIPRRKLTLEEVEKSAIEISKTKIKHILFLTGEAPEITDMSYLIEVTRILKKYFPFVGVEIFPLEVEDYRKLIEAGADGLTIYQETYDRKVYELVHPAGRKRNYLYRLDTPERGAQAGFKSINIGPLYGLAEPVREAFLCGLHARYLQNKYIECEISVSFPRLNPAEGNFKPKYMLSNKKFVQFILALRLFLPRCGINISTRESPKMRDNLIPLGITRMSAGSRTNVGGYLENSPSNSSLKQFEIFDNRSVDEVEKVIWEKGYEPVFKDWEWGL